MSDPYVNVLLLRLPILVGISLREKRENEEVYDYQS